MENKELGAVAGCGLCGIPAFDEDHELLEHNISLVHHLKLNEPSKSCKHRCELCHVTASSICNYVTHLEGKKHKKALEMFKRKKQKKEPPCENSNKRKANGSSKGKKNGCQSKRKASDEERVCKTRAVEPSGKGSVKSCNGTGGKPVPLREQERQHGEDEAEAEEEEEFGDRKESMNMWQGGGAGPGQGSNYWQQQQQWSYQGNYRGYQNHQGYYQQPRFNHPPLGYQQQWRPYGNRGGGIPPFRGIQFHHQQPYDWNGNTSSYCYRGGQQQGGEASASAEQGRGSIRATEGWLSSCYGGKEPTTAPEAPTDASAPGSASCRDRSPLSKKSSGEAPKTNAVHSVEKTAERIKKEKVVEQEGSCSLSGSERHDVKNHLIFLSSEEEEEAGGQKGKKKGKVQQETKTTISGAQRKGKAATGPGECTPTRSKGSPRGPAAPCTPPASGGAAPNETFRKDVLDRLVNFPCSRRLCSQLSKWVTQLKKAPQGQGHSQHPGKPTSTLTLLSAQKLDLQGLVKEMEAGDLPDELLHSLMNALDESSDAEHEGETTTAQHKVTEGQSQAKPKEGNAKMPKKTAPAKTAAAKSVEDTSAKSTTKLSTAKPSTTKVSATKSATKKVSTAKSTGKPSTVNASTAKPPPAKPSTAKPPPAKPSTAKLPPAKPSTAKLPPAKPSAAKSPPTKPSAAKPPPTKPSAAKLPPAKPSTTNSAEPGQPKETPPVQTSGGEEENGKGQDESEEECVVVPTPPKVVESVELTDSDDDDCLPRSLLPSGTDEPSGNTGHQPAPLRTEARHEPNQGPCAPAQRATPREDVRSGPPSVPRPSSAPSGPQCNTPLPSNRNSLPRPASEPKGAAESVLRGATAMDVHPQETRKVGEDPLSRFPAQQDTGVAVGVTKKEEESEGENPGALVDELIALCQEEEQVRTQCALAQRNIVALKSAVDQWKLKEEQLSAREEQIRKRRLHLLRSLQDSVGTSHGRMDGMAAKQAQLLEALGKKSRPSLPPDTDVVGAAMASEDVCVGSGANATGVTYLGALDTTLDIMQQILPHMQQLGDIDTLPMAALATAQDPTTTTATIPATVPTTPPNLRGAVKRKKSAETSAKSKKTKLGRTDQEADLDESRLKDIPATLEIKAHDGAVVAVKLHKGYVFTCSTDYTAKRFDLADPLKCIVYGGHMKALSSLEVQAAKGVPTLLYTSCRDGYLRCFDADSGERILELDLESPIGCTAAAWGRLYLGLHSGHVVVFNLKGQQVVERYACSEGPVGRLCTAAEGAQRLLCTVAADGRVGVRDAATGLLLRCLGSRPGDGGSSSPALVRPPACLALAAGFVYTASSDRTVMVHELRTGNLQKVYEAKSSATGMRLYKNYLLCCSFDGLIRCYRLKDFFCDVVYYGAGKNMVMTMDTCGPLIATGNRKGVVELITFDKSTLHVCEVGSCRLQFGREEDLVHHLKREHLALGAPSVQARCPWHHCNMAFVGPTSSKDFEKHLMDHACT